MLRLKPRQREMLADKLPDLANIGAAILVLGQFVGQQPLSPPLFVAGLAMWALLSAVAFSIAEEQNDSDGERSRLLRRHHRPRSDCRDPRLVDTAKGRTAA